MNDDESEDESDIKICESEKSAKLDINDGTGEDFDEFEAGSDEDFGDFDEGFQHPSAPDEESEEPEPSIPPVQSLPPPISPFVSNISATIKGTIPAHLIVMD